MRFWETPKFKRLSAEWERKLEASGFDDHEVSVGAGRELKQRSANVYRQAGELLRFSKERYYELLAQGVAAHKWPPFPADEVIMLLRSRGRTATEIGSFLKDLGHYHERHRVGKIIKRYEDLWKIRSK